MQASFNNQSVRFPQASPESAPEEDNSQAYVMEDG
jgi:hypothetical protein